MKVEFTEIKQKESVGLSVYDLQMDKVYRIVRCDNDAFLVGSIIRKHYAPRTPEYIGNVLKSNYEDWRVFISNGKRGEYAMTARFEEIPHGKITTEW